MKKIALCGFMGCGKSTVAKALSDSYNLVHIDTDDYIQKTQNSTINDIFNSYGEAYFRNLEHDAIKALSKNDYVLSLGGGAVMFERNVSTLKHSGYQIVFINTAFDVIKERLFSDNSRPLLKSNDIKTLYESRLDTYKRICDTEICCNNESALQIAKMIIEKTQ